VLWGEHACAVFHLGENGVLRKLIFAAVFVLTLAANAQGTSIKVVTEEWPPYTCSKNGKIEGVVSEIIRATLDRSGLDYTIEVYPWARAYEMAQKEENVLIYSIFKLPTREHLFQWIEIDGLSVNMSLFRPKHRTDINLTSLEDARKYKIGVTRESSTHHFLLSKGFVDGVNLFPVNSEEQNTLKTTPEVKRIDLTTGDKLYLARCLKECKLPSDYWVEQVPLFKEDFYMAFGLRTSDKVVDKVHKAFHEIKAEGKLDAIAEKYYKLFE